MAERHRQISYHYGQLRSLQILPSSIWSSALALSAKRNNTISSQPKRQLGSEGPIRKMYMDNVVTGTDCDEKALEYYSLSRSYLQEAGMNLRQWTSNSAALNRKAQEDNTEAAQTTKILGLTWNSTCDMLSLSLEKMIRETENIKRPTKRSALSFASKLFDPLGFVEPITVKAKIMIQDLWKQNISWDEDLSNEQKEQWLTWIGDISSLTSIEVPRPYFLTNISEKQLHIFCDSSKLAYGAVAYLRGTSGNKTYTAFLMAKTRVAPVKTQTLPRLELLAAVLATKQMLEARTLLLKATQQTTYRQEISYLKNKDKFKEPAIIQQLNLYLDDGGLIRCRGRLEYTDLPHDTKFPILIPKDNYLTTLIVQYMHKVVMHGGVRETLTQIRQTYWIPQGRQLVKRIISKCVTCRKIQGPPFRSEPTPPLPRSRVQQSQAFQFTGIDYAGPLYVRNQGNQTSSKMYICLFTCATVRALHLELVEDQTTQAFLRAFRRFISRRGIPECIISDNAKTLKAGAEELQTMKTQVLGTNTSKQFLANHSISWKFITERAPGWGGFYERLVWTSEEDA